MPNQISGAYTSIMDRLKDILSWRKSYEPLADSRSQLLETEGDVEAEDIRKDPDAFSWVDYIVFLLLGNAMLWAWYDFRLRLMLYHN